MNHGLEDSSKPRPYLSVVVTSRNDNHGCNMLHRMEAFVHGLAHQCQKFQLLHELVRRYPGFASDMFLKRAFLFVMQLYRKLNFFSDTIDQIPVPADYQVPKMLEYFGCLMYSPELIHKIKSHRMIPRYSIEEISIRAGTIMVCDRLSELTGWNKSEIDAWLWLRRKECKKPFHLTITTDY